MTSPALWKVELHCHTHASGDSRADPARLVAAARRKGLDRLAITDHNTTTGAFEAAALDPERVIVGEEILTTEGELLAYFLREEIPRGLSPEATIDRLRAQGAVIAVSHPFDYVRRGAWPEASLRRILPLVDALEVFNARTWDARPNRRAAEWARQAGLPGIAGSDAHAAFEVGTARTLLEPFTDADSFRRALASARIEGRRSSPWVHLVSRYASWSKRRNR
jgi:predicted metal-dependent phosphoesterase TrpH